MESKKLVLVTGGSRGIGFAIVKSLLIDGFKVLMITRNKNDLTKAKNELKEFGEVDYIILDLSDTDQVKEFCENWSTIIYGLINNAGRWTEERLEGPDSGAWEIMKLNLDGLYFLTKGLINFIEDGGRIINVSSQLGTSGRAGMGVYSASKHAVLGLTKSWALELADRQITVNAVCPGWIDTISNQVEILEKAKIEGLTFQEKMQQIALPLPLHRFITTEEVANLVNFLTSTKSTGVTGQVYEIK